MDNFKNSKTNAANAQPKRKIRYSGKPLVVGLIFECDDRDAAYKVRLKSAITYQIQQRLGQSGVEVEFAEAKINAKYFRRINPDHYDAHAWKQAEQELSCVTRFLQSKHANHIVIASQALIKYQPIIDLLDILPHESPDFANEPSSFAVDLYHNEINTVDKNSGERRCFNNCISVGMIGRDSLVALLSNRIDKLTDYSEVRREFSGVLVRWCVMPSFLRQEFYQRLDSQDFEAKIKAHRRWLVDTLARLPRTYTKRKIKSRDISPAKIHSIILTDTKTEMMFLGLTKKQYFEVASKPGEIRRRLHNVTRHTDNWPEREIGEGKVEIYGVIDIFAQAITDMICQKRSVAAFASRRPRQVVTYQEIDERWGGTFNTQGKDDPLLKQLANMDWASL